MKHENYDALSKHPFVTEVFKKAMEINKEIAQPSGFKAEANFSREPNEEEFYCLQVAYCLSHLLNVIQQMEHTIHYMGNFSPTKPMKNAGITRSSHLLWSVENYIIRSQSVYDRLLILVDRLFHIHNQPNRISHESVVTNLHIARTKIPKALKPVKSALKKYYYDRNTIVHEASYLDSDLRKIEAYTILSTGDEEETYKEHLKEDLKWDIREFLKKRKREFSRINSNVCLSTKNIFEVMNPIFLNKYSEICKKNC